MMNSQTQNQALKSQEAADKRSLKNVEKEAASWLLLAYSLGHEDDCACQPCGNARAKLQKAKIAAA